jgi:hypothetical protein
LTARKAKIYFARVNLAGLYDSKPTILYKDEEFYSSKDGNICVSLKDKKRLSPGYGSIDFWSEDEDEVKLWLKGASAVMHMLYNWSRPSTAKKETANDR